MAKFEENQCADPIKLPDNWEPDWIREQRAKQLQRDIAEPEIVSVRENVIAVELVQPPDDDDRPIALLTSIRHRHDTWAVYLITLTDGEISDRHQLHAFYGAESWDSAISYAHSEATKRGITAITCNGVKHE